MTREKGKRAAQGHLGVTHSYRGWVTPKATPTYPRMSTDAVVRYRTMHNKKASSFRGFMSFLDFFGLLVGGGGGN